MRILVRIYCKENDKINSHYIMVEENMSIKQLMTKVKKENLGQLLRIEIL